MILEEEKWPKQFCSRKSWQIEKDRALFPAKRGRKLESEWQLLLWPWEKIQSTSTNNVFIFPTGWGHIMDQFPKLKILFCFCQFAGQVGCLTPCSLYKFQVPFKWKKNFMFSPPDVCKTNISRWWLWLYKTIVKIGGEYLNPHWMEMMKTMVRFGGVDVIWWGITLSDRSWVTTSPDAKASPSQRQRWWWRWLC